MPEAARVRIDLKAIFDGWYRRSSTRTQDTMPAPAYVRIDVKTVFNAWFVRIIEKYAGVADSTDSSDSGIDEDRELTWIFKQMFGFGMGP